MLKPDSIGGSILTLPMGQEATVILQAIHEGRPHAAEELLPLVYEELRGLAESYMRNESAGHTLQATALVSEAYLKLVHSDNHPGFVNRKHFCVAAAEAMRRILIDYARQKKSQKRGGKWRRLGLDDVDLSNPEITAAVIDLEEALVRLAIEHPDHATFVRLRFYVGLSMVEVASILEMSVSTARRVWTFARAWLFDDLEAADQIDILATED